VTREQRLRAALTGTGLEEQAADLASLPAAQVDLIVSAIRASHRAGREHERQVRRQRKADARNHRWYDEDQLTRKNVGSISAAGQRARTNPDALAGLAQARAAIDREIDHAVIQLRREYPDTEIAAVLGFTSAAIGQRYGPRKARLSPGPDLVPERVPGSSQLEGRRASRRRAG
jgi:hypothetical protein